MENVEWIDLNDEVEITLTEDGAKIMNAKNVYENLILKRAKVNVQQKIDYKENDKYSDQLWCIIQIFANGVGLGNNMPFNDLHKE
jgi:hypothetical protein